MSRVVQGLYLARRVAKPEFIRTTRPHGAKAQGLRYERLVAKAIPQALHNPWFHFADANGKGWCSPDLLLIHQNQAVVFEVKLTDTVDAIGQLANLYFPVLQKALRLPVRGIIVVKNLTPETDRSRITASLAEALAQPAESIPLLHWLGRGRI